MDVNYFAQNPEQGRLFDEAMTSFSVPEIAGVMAAYDFSGIDRLVDVAGGQFGLDYLQPGTTMTTADLFVRYLRPIRQGAALAVPRMLRAGRRAMVMQIDIYGEGDDEVAATLPVVQHTMQDAPFPAVLLSLPLQVDARAANNWDEAH